MTQSSAPPDRAGWDRPTISAAVALAAAAAFFAVGTLIRVSLWLEEPNEGWNGLHAMAAFSRALYPAPPALVLNNYPPLWFYLTGALAEVFGDPIFPGRVVGLIAFAWTAAAIFVLARGLKIGAPATLIGALGFAVTVEAFFGLEAGLAEPQMLAHAMAATAAAMALGATQRRTVVAAALLTVVALLVKQVAIGLPLAVTLWLLWRRRDLALVWIVTGAVAAALALAALALGYGPPFLGALTAPRYLSAERLGTSLGLTMRVVVPLVAFAVVAVAARRRRDEALAFAALAVGAAFVPLVVFGSALGVSVNIGLDLAIAANLGLAAAWSRAATALGSRAGLWRGGVLAAFVVVLATELGGDAAQLAINPAARAALARQSASNLALRDRLRGVSGPVACETLSVCDWAGKPSVADLWKLRHETTLAFMNPAPLLAGIRAGRLGAVVTMGPVASPADDGHLPGLAAALAAGYAQPMVFPAGGALYLPKPRP
ncbi:MAG TPA: glycosyltransferase family 39 protein [Caulobacteraceae bacterium]|jgi:hypothetical protein